MTYAELGACGEQVGAWLRSHGVLPDCVVALQLDRSLEQVVGIVGVLRSGGAYLPLDPQWPVSRRRFMVEDASCGHLVAQRVHAAEYGGWFVGAVLELVFELTDSQWRKADIWCLMILKIHRIYDLLLRLLLLLQ